jgi:hypothetical protein
MTRTERLTERAIAFAIAEVDKDLAVARLAFLTLGDPRPWMRPSTPAWPAPNAPSIPAGGH